MAAFTINSGGIVEWDSLSGGSTNATLDSYTISNRSTLRIACDSYQCANHSVAFGSLDTVAFSGTGGTLLLDASEVRVLPFGSGTGTVPAIGTTISRGDASGALLGVWANWQSEPLAAGAAMPTTGYIKLKSRVGLLVFTVGALTGIGASSTGPDVQGWIEVRGADTAAITVPRVGSVQTYGDWFELGVTTGVRGQILPCPTTATTAGVFPAIWVESSAGSGQFERYAGVGSMVNSATTPTDVRGKIFWQTTAGIRLGSNGTNDVGYLPPAGCRVRIPSVIMTCCTRTVSGSGARVLPNATLATRQEFITTAAGDIGLASAVIFWYCNFAQAYSAGMIDCAVSSTLILSEIAAPLSIDNVVVAPCQAQLATALAITSCSGGTVQNSLFARFSLAASNAYVNSVTYSSGITFSYVDTLTLLNRGNASTGTWSVLGSSGCTWSYCKNIGARALFTTCTRTLIEGTYYADVFSGTTGTGNANTSLDFSTCTDTIVDSIYFDWASVNIHPYTSVASATACNTFLLRNVGYPDGGEVNLGSANATGLLFNSGGNNKNVRLRHNWVINTRTGLWVFQNSDDGVLVENTFGDYADTSVMAAKNAIVKGAGLTGSTTGQISVYGTHWADQYNSATQGRIVLFCNEPTILTVGQQCEITAGTPRFNSSGSVAMTAVGDQVTWEMPYKAFGHSEFAALASLPTGTNALTNHTFEFQIDQGSGYSAWTDLNQANLVALGPLDPDLGFRMKIRATCSTANASNLLTSITLRTVTDSALHVYDRYVENVSTTTFEGLPEGTDVVVLSGDTGAILDQQDEVAGGAYFYTGPAGSYVDIGFLKEGYVPFYIRNFGIPTSNSSVPVTLTPDRNFI